MKLLYIALVNMKRFLKTPQVIGSIIMQVVFIFIFSTGSGQSATSSLGAIKIINKDTGVYSSELIDTLSENYSVYITGNDGSTSEEDTVIYINDDFTSSLEEWKKPIVKVKGPKDDALTISAINDIETFNNTKLKESFISGYNENTFSLKSSEVNKEANPMPFVMLCYFMLIGGSMIAEDTIKLKNSNVLKRALTTSNTSYTIIGGLFLGILALQWVLTSIIYLVASIKVDFGISIFGALGIILAFSALSTSICLFTARIGKNQAIASMVGIVYAVAAFFFMFLDIFKIGGEVISKLSALFPFHWVLKGISDGSVLISIGMILLMAAVFFTAGGFKYKNFINEI